MAKFDFRNSKARSALAKSSVTQIVLSGDYADELSKFSAMCQDLGITFDENNNVYENWAKAKINDLLSRLSALEERLSNYENHTHSYIDDTIEDTEDGSGAKVSTTKSTGVVE